jgi:hypothetical protein
MAQEEVDTPETTTFSETAPRPKKYYLFSSKASITVPHPMGNASFKKCFVGVYELNGGFNLMLYKGLFVGATYKNSLLKIIENKIPGYNANMTMNSVAGKIGGDFYVGTKNSIIFSTAVSVGQNNTVYSKFKTKDAKEHPLAGFKSAYLEPEVNLFFLIEDNFALGATLTYTVIQRNFDPYELYLNEWSSFSKNNSGSTHYLSFGFGFYYGISKR